VFTAAGIRSELIRIRGEVRRTKTLLPKDGFPLLDAASRDHQTMVKEIERVKPELRDELFRLATSVGEEGRRARIALEWFAGH
jgi:hypothetical protein